jgi:phosphoglycerate dehydrogenase-like enzyme
MDGPIGNYRRTVGLIGASRIGRKVVTLLRALDVEVLLTDPFVTAATRYASARLVDLDVLLQRSDVVSIHAPSLPSTRHLDGARELRLLRDGAALINTDIAGPWSTRRLDRRTADRRIQAVLDVTDPEIPPDGSPFYDLPNVFLTPHVAGAPAPSACGSA